MNCERFGPLCRYCQRLMGGGGGAGVYEPTDRPTDEASDRPTERLLW